MADWLYQPIESRQRGRNIFRLPYPGGSWIDEMRRNEELLYLMDMARQTAIAGYKQKHDKKLDDNDQRIIELVAEALT